MSYTEAQIESALNEMGWLPNKDTVREFVSALERQQPLCALPHHQDAVDLLQRLPNVGPVTRDEDGYYLVQGVTHGHGHATTAEEAFGYAARWLAVGDYITTKGERVRELADRMRDAVRGRAGSIDEQWLIAAREALKSMEGRDDE